jgi:two-component system sensor histidine kinase KdpD
LKKLRFPFSIRTLYNSLMAILLVSTTTVPLWLIGRDTLGEAAIALLYLLPVAWSAYRWGKLPGISAALTASLAFNFFFIPPFYTFFIGSLEGWLVLAIFIGVAIVVVGQIQSSVVRAREMTFMYELCASLAGVRTPGAVAYTLARHIQQLYAASLVMVMYKDVPTGASEAVSQPEGASSEERPDRILPLINAWGLVGEIHIWRGAFSELPPVDSALLQNFASQAGKAFERIHDLRIERPV